MMIMKNKTNYCRLFILFCITANFLYGRLPGDSSDPSTRLYRGYAYGSVLDTENKPVENARISVNLNLFFNYEEPTPRKVNVAVGYTNQYGYFNITVDVNVPNRWGSPKAHYMDAIVTGGPKCYAVDHSEGSRSLTSFFIRPIFNIIVDCDGNEIDDNKEKLLSEKFCPTYILSSKSRFVRPEPVEYLGVNSSDLWYYLIDASGREVGNYPIAEGMKYNPPLDDYYYFAGGSNRNYSTLTSKNLPYTGKPGSRNASSKYYLMFYHNYAGDCNSSTCWSDEYNFERINNEYPNTVYAHLFKHENFIIIQYWTFYPYNDFINNHEGDWEHINVWVSDDNPDLASIVKVEYYFHKQYLVRYSDPNGSLIPDSFEISNKTHTKVYVGGQNITAPGQHSGGNFPDPGIWPAAGELCADENVKAEGPEIHWNSFINKNEKYGIVILPDPDDIDYNERPEMSWFKADLYWGYLDVKSYGDWSKVIPFVNVGNTPPRGPAYRDGWGKVGSGGGKYKIYEPCPKNPRR